ncbi:hypothetical protein BDK51DRAFT_33019 [Blyttiomyces helicus]|uniref:Uncharacterized protein n=1 Tax=Blyttiomyces helicus TaxID=388810 RepID=A0A4V1IS03_9FUNG|nr:hypothetical protein BDK51DRAFT_33019 [Blyttiomyces helicus]|eukprot:RKO91857.1 hypothetical protein BDK51DRAFT_33019 [Blyttiomyces helicus]
MAFLGCRGQFPREAWRGARPILHAGKPDSFAVVRFGRPALENASSSSPPQLPSLTPETTSTWTTQLRLWDELFIYDIRITVTRQPRPFSSPRPGTVTSTTHPDDTASNYQQILGSKGGCILLSVHRWDFSQIFEDSLFQLRRSADMSKTELMEYPTIRRHNLRELVLPRDCPIIDPPSSHLDLRVPAAGLYLLRHVNDLFMTLSLGFCEVAAQCPTTRRAEAVEVCGLRLRYIVTKYRLRQDDCVDCDQSMTAGGWT